MSSCTYYFLTSKALVFEMANAAVEVFANGLVAADFIEYFGRCFIRSFDRYGYEKILRVKLCFRGL